MKRINKAIFFLKKMHVYFAWLHQFLNRTKANTTVLTSNSKYEKKKKNHKLIPFRFIKITQKQILHVIGCFIIRKQNYIGEGDEKQQQ